MQPEFANNQQSASNSDPNFIFKFIIIGDTGVGKSCFLLQFIDNRFRLKHEPTIGVQFGAKIIPVKTVSTLNNSSNNKCRCVKLQIWDTAGQQSFRSITRGYYRSAAGAILIYDITNPASFENLSHWLNEARVSGNSQMNFILVGNKCDLQIDRKVTYEQGAQFAQQNGMTFLETSAKTGFNIGQAFTKAADQIVDKIDSGKIDLNHVPPGIKVGLIKKSTFDSQKLNDKITDAKTKCC